jgi:AraC-like DNA-binding protein
VFIPHARPRDIGPYRRLLKVQPRFDAEFCAIRFAASWLSRPVAGSDPVRRREALAQLEAAGAGEFVDQVIRAVRTVLLQGKHSGDDVAQMLSMHRRTLNRRLQARGTTFQQVLDKVRFDVARQLLGESDIPLDDVANHAGTVAACRSGCPIGPRRIPFARVRRALRRGDRGPSCRLMLSWRPAAWTGCAACAAATATG